MGHGLHVFDAVRHRANSIGDDALQVDPARKPLLKRLSLIGGAARDLPGCKCRWLSHGSIPHLRNGAHSFIAHVLVQQRVACREKLVVVLSVLNRAGRVHLKNGQKHRFRQLEFKARCRRTAWMRQGKPFRPAMIDRRPEFARSVPRGSLLLIDAILKKIVRAGLVRSRSLASV